MASLMPDGAGIYFMITVIIAGDKYYERVQIAATASPLPDRHALRCAQPQSLLYSNAPRHAVLFRHIF
jgi:hypothetical protein